MTGDNRALPSARATAAEPVVSALRDGIANAKSVRKVLAFAVTDNYENEGGIVFAKTSVAARRRGADQYADGEFSDVSCRRASWADAYAETGKVPASVMVEHGWHFECAGCGRWIDEDGHYERDLDVAEIIGTQYSAVFCNAVCEARQRLDAAEADYCQKRWIRRFSKLVLKKFPSARLCVGEGFKGPHAYASRRNGKPSIRQVVIPFEFDGMQFGPASLRMDEYSGRRNKPAWSCCGGDKDAFEAFAAKAMEARQGGNGEAGAVHDSAVACNLPKDAGHA